jgi:hypothetical protein
MEVQRLQNTGFFEFWKPWTAIVVLQIRMRLTTKHLIRTRRLEKLISIQDWTNLDKKKIYLFIYLAGFAN